MSERYSFQFGTREAVHDAAGTPLHTLTKWEQTRQDYCELLDLGAQALDTVPEGVIAMQLDEPFDVDQLAAALGIGSVLKAGDFPVPPTTVRDWRKEPGRRRQLLVMMYGLQQRYLQECAGRVGGREQLRHHLLTLGIAEADLVLLYRQRPKVVLKLLAAANSGQPPA